MTQVEKNREVRLGVEANTVEKRQSGGLAIDLRRRHVVVGAVEGDHGMKQVEQVQHSNRRENRQDRYNEQTVFPGRAKRREP